MQRPRLLALDLDGTLLLREGGVHASDVAAIERARSQGVVVTLATGRLTTGTLPTARALDLDAPMICADGATTACAKTGRVLDHRALTVETVEVLLATILAHDLVPYVFGHDTIHCEASGRAHDDYVRIWTERIHFHESLYDARAWRGEGEVAMTLAIGERERVERVEQVLTKALGHTVDSTPFTISGPHVLRSSSTGCSKGAALERVAERLGIASADVAVVGDWLNDLSMFAFAGRSFAMAGAPEVVSSAATDRLEARAGRGGGVAEAIERWLQDG
jgi:Cof subfamily protein (haloacid dehalogenase superfamily)